jgi:transposase
MTNLINLNAAGIDVSAKEHYVAVPEDRDTESIRCFKSFTRDLHLMAKWLLKCKIKTIAMESTGVYWYHLYTVLLDYGFEVYLVNAYHVKNVPGRKSDVSDARWLQRLHSFGLLSPCFQPDNLTRELRNSTRQRKSIIKDMSTQTQRMQKALELMNIKLNNVIRDINGKTGHMIVSAILDGETNPEILASYADYRIKATKENLIKSLEGNWRKEQLFNLKQAYDHINFLQHQLKECDKQTEEILDQFSRLTKDAKPLQKGVKSKNSPSFNAKQYLYEIIGVDVTKIYGLQETNALTIFSETGCNLAEKFPTEKQFLSWLNVVPDNKITGAKVISSKVRKKKNKAGQAFRDSANTLWRANNPWGDYLRIKKAKSGSRQAVVATAKKIASVYYKMVVDKVDFDDAKIKNNRNDYFSKKLNYLQKMMEKTQLQLTVYHID